MCIKKTTAGLRGECLDMTVEVTKGGKVYSQRYKIGVPVSDLKVIGMCDKIEHGTKVEFMPDDSIFTSLDFVPASTFREDVDRVGAKN